LIARFANSFTEVLLFEGKKAIVNFSKNLSKLVSGGEINTTPTPSTCWFIQLDGYCIFIPKVELFCYVKKELLVVEVVLVQSQVTGVVVVVCPIVC